jgi:hypothetical protein
MASSIGGPGSHDFGQYEQLGEEEEQHAPEAEATTSTAGPAQQQVTQQQIAARYDTSEQHMGPTDDPPAFSDISTDQLLASTTTPRQQQRLQRQASNLRSASLPSAPEYPSGAAPASRPPTSLARRVTSAWSLRTRGSASSLRTQANASRTSLPGGNPAGEALPPVPPLPASVRQRQATGDTATSGQSGPQGPANLAVPEEAPAKRSGFFSRRTPQEVQDDRNHKLRDAVTNGDPAGITRRLGKGADPTAPSSINQQNAFHKLASTSKFNRDTTQALVAATNAIPHASLGQAAVAKDVNGNTPIHIAQHNLGKAETNNNPDMERRYRDLRDRLTEAATNNGHDVDAIANNEGRTPRQMRQTGRQAVEAAIEREERLRGDLGGAHLL